MVNSDTRLTDEKPRSARGAAGLRVAALGGGTGLSTMLRGLKMCTESITAIVTVTDNGGGSGLLRQDLGILPPGDIRNCLLALANVEHTLSELLHYRFREGSLAGQSFGNLFLAALCGVCGSFEEAVARMGEALAITGRVLPVTTADVHLKASFEDGTTVVGETEIVRYKKQLGFRVQKIELVPPRPEPLASSLRAIEEADLLLIGPGSLYTSLIPNLLVKGIPEAIARTKALRVYVCNIMTQEGETEGYTAGDHIREIHRHAGASLVDVCLANRGPVSSALRARYEEEGAAPMVVDRARIESMGVAVEEASLIHAHSPYARHDPYLLAAAIVSLYEKLRM